MRRSRLLQAAAAVTIGAAVIAAVRVTDEPAPVTWREGEVRFKTTCNFDHAAPDDPIVFPGQPGASHLHDFTGRRGITASTTTYEQLTATGAKTTCNDPQDLAGYWSPAAYIGGVKVDPVHMTAYYRRGLKTAPIQPFPDGLKMIAGPDGLSGWQCSEADRNAPKPAPTGCTGEAVMVVEFPDCGDGRTDTGIGGDHRAHMAYAQGGVCPPSHPVPMPELTTYTHFPLPPGKTITVLSSGPPNTLHEDFFNGWNRARQQELIDRCLTALVKCASGKATP